MDTKEPPSQDTAPPGDHQAQPVQKVQEVPSGPPGTPPITETLTPQELELFGQFSANSLRSSSPPPKNAKIDPEPELQEFLEALAAKNIELSDLDYNLQQELETRELPTSQS